MRLTLQSVLLLFVLQLPHSLFAENVLILSDIHFNPFADSVPGQPCPDIDTLVLNPNVDGWHFKSGSFPTYGRETNYTSFSADLTEIHRIAVKDNIRNVLVCGDLLEHRFSAEYLKYENKPDHLATFSSNVILYVLNQIRIATNNSHIYYILGNNDSDLGNYKLPTSAFSSNLAKGLFDHSQERNIRTFTELGYFSAALNDSIQVIGLNGGLLSYTNPVCNMAAKQLALLQQDLEVCRKDGRQALIMIHEPFGINPIYSFLSKHADPNLNQELQGEYLNLLTKYAGCIPAIYAGHYHMEYFEAIGDRIPLIGTIAMNSVNRNNPGFKVISMNSATGQLTDYTTYYEDISATSPRWSVLYNFDATYNPGRRSVIDVINSFPSDPDDPAVRSYCSFFNGKSTKLPSINSKGIWPYYFTSIGHLDTGSYRTYINVNFPWVQCELPPNAPASGQNN